MFYVMSIVQKGSLN